MKSTVIINGSARGDGASEKLIQLIQEIRSYPTIELRNYEIGHYDYLHENRNDDFLPLMKHLILNYSSFILVSPVYWYAMSGHLKVFLDRWTDLITIEKDWGRKLRGKEMAVVTSSYGNHLDDHFWLPFEHTANYLGMQFKGGLHTLEGQTNKNQITEFVERIK